MINFEVEESPAQSAKHIYGVMLCKCLLPLANCCAPDFDCLVQIVGAHVLHSRWGIQQDYLDSAQVVAVALMNSRI